MLGAIPLQKASIRDKRGNMACGILLYTVHGGEEYGVFIHPIRSRRNHEIKGRHFLRSLNDSWLTSIPFTWKAQLLQDVVERYGVQVIAKVIHFLA